MLKRNILLCFLVLFIMTFNSIASATAPYASIVAYNAGNRGGKTNTPNVSTLGVLDIVNMTPWDISIGPAPLDTPMMSGMAAQSWISFWLAGFHKPGSNTGNFGGSFAFHSYQLPLNNLNNAWVLKNSIARTKNGLSGWLDVVYYETIPIVFNSNSLQQGAKTVALNFSATSSMGFSGLNNSGEFPGSTLSFGDGTNNYGWESGDVMGFSGYPSASQFLTVQALQGASWKPITKNLGGVAPNIAKDGPQKGTTVQSPNLLNVAGLVYPNFSVIAGDTQNLDLVVILQAGGYGDMQLLFLAVPNSNNSFR